MDQHLVDAMRQYESGDMSDDAALDMFQELINTGLAWQLQGHYGREAQALIDAGWCDPPPEGE